MQYISKPCSFNSSHIEVELRVIWMTVHTEEGLGIGSAVVQEEGLGIDPAVGQEEGLGIDQRTDHDSCSMFVKGCKL